MQLTPKPNHDNWKHKVRFGHSSHKKDFTLQSPPLRPSGLLNFNVNIIKDKWC